MNERWIHYLLSAGVGLLSGVIGTLGAMKIALDDLHANDRRQDALLERIDREGTQVSRADRATLAEFKTRLDRLESNQILALAQSARVEALLLDLKQRLNQ